MAKQQNVIHQENHRLQRLNESEAETIDDLHEHAECELKQVIKQYETQIRGSIENYGKKIYLIRVKKDQLMDQLQKKNGIEDQQSKEIALLNGRVDKYENQLEQLRNELQRLQHQKSKDRVLESHAIDQFTAPRYLKKGGGAAGNKRTRHFSKSDAFTDLDSGAKTEEETTEVILNATEYKDVYSDTPLKTSSRVEMQLGDIISPHEDNVDFKPSVTPIRKESGEMNETLYYTIHHLNVNEDNCALDSHANKTSSLKLERKDGPLEYHAKSSSNGVQTNICRKQVDPSKPKILLRNEGTSPDLEDDVSLTSSYNTETDQSEGDVTTTPNIDEVIEQDYDEVDWEEFPNLVEYTFKVILCGDAAVGKTSFLNQLCLGEFRESTIATIGMSFFRQKFKVRRNGSWTGVELQCWDTAGQEKFRSLPQSYFRNSDAAILIFDLTKRHTFHSLYDWIDRIEQVADFPRLVVVGNKCDLTAREVSYQEAYKVVQTVDARYFEGSAKTGEGVSFVFKHLTENLVDDFEKKSRGHVVSAATSSEAKLSDGGKLNLTAQSRKQRGSKEFSCLGTSCPN